MNAAADIQITGGGTVYLFRPLTCRADTWLHKHTPNDAPWLGNALAVEHRYVCDLIDALIAHEFKLTR